jgi:hypothetical protein
MLTARSLVATAALAVAAIATPAGAVMSTPDHPGVAVGVSGDFRSIEFFETATGDVYAEASIGSEVLSLDVSVVRQEVYYATLRGHAPVIFRMPMGGGPSDVVVDGHDPVVSANGRYLAYAFDPDSADGPARESVTVRDLDTGVERIFPDLRGPTPEVEDSGIDGLAISPDGSAVAYSYTYEGEILLLDTTTAITLADARSVLAPAAGDLSGGYYSPAFLADGRVAAAGFDFGLVAVDPLTGARETLVSHFGAVVVLDADQTGHHLIATVLRMDRPGSQVVFLTDGVESARLDAHFPGARW